MNPNWETLPNRGGPAGGGYVSAVDWIRFGDALRSGKLVSRAWLDSLWTARVKTSIMTQETWYGYGFFVRQTALGRRVGHTGGSPGVADAVDIYPDKGYVVAVLTNQDGPGLQIAMRKITAGLEGVERATRGSGSP